MKALLIVVLLSVSSYANASIEGALICSNQNMEIVQGRGSLALVLKHADGSVSNLKLQTDGNSQDRWTSYESKGTVVPQYYNSVPAIGTYSLVVPKIPGVGQLSLNINAKDSNIELDCIRNRVYP